MFYCDITNIPVELQKLINSKNDCFNNGGDWINKDNNFDNIFNAMVTLFIIATTEGWLGLMYLNKL